MMDELRKYRVKSVFNISIDDLDSSDAERLGKPVGL